MWQDVVRLYYSFYVFAAALQKKPSALIRLTSQSTVFEDCCMGDGCVTCSCGCTDEASHLALGKCPWGAWAVAETPKLKTTAKKHLPCCQQSASSSHSGLCQKGETDSVALTSGASANPLWKLERGVGSSEETWGDVSQARWGRAL